MKKQKHAPAQPELVLEEIIPSKVDPVGEPQKGSRLTLRWPTPAGLSCSGTPPKIQPPSVEVLAMPLAELTTIAVGSVVFQPPEVPYFLGQACMSARTQWKNNAALGRNRQHRCR